MLLNTNGVFHGKCPTLRHIKTPVVLAAAQPASLPLPELWPAGACGVSGSRGKQLHGSAADVSTLRGLPDQARGEGEDVEEEMVPVRHGPQTTSLLYRLDWLERPCVCVCVCAVNLHVRGCVRMNKKLLCHCLCSQKGIQCKILHFASIHPFIVHSLHGQNKSHHLDFVDKRLETPAGKKKILQWLICFN